MKLFEIEWQKAVARYNQLTWWLEHSRKDRSFPEFLFWMIRMEPKNHGNLIWPANRKMAMKFGFIGVPSLRIIHQPPAILHQHLIEPVEVFGYPNPKWSPLTLNQRSVIFRIIYEAPLRSLETPSEKIGVCLKIGDALR